MAFQKCKDCGFNIVAPHASCPNCGNNYPVSEMKRSKTATGLVLAGLFGFLTSFGIALLLQAPIIIIGALPAIVLAGLGLQLNDKVNSRTAECLVEFENQINSRILEIEKRRIRLEELLIRIDASSQTESIRNTKNIIEHGTTILELYRSKYDIEKRRIWLIRWKNGYEPYMHHVQNIAGVENMEEIDSIKQILDVGKNMYEEVIRAGTFAHVMGESFLEDFRSSISACQLVYETLINTQALSVLREVSPIDATSESSQNAGDSDTIQLERIDAVSDFKAAFDRLEDEYSRIKAEEELAI
jgi:hypothetical protein